MNLFGFSIDGLDVPLFLTVIRLTFVVAVMAGAGLLAKSSNTQKAARVVLGLAIFGFALAWLATMFPLPNVYGTNGSQDRENHLGWANMVAQGFSPLRTFQVNHLHFEPVWPLLTAIASGFNVDRVPLIFQLAPLLMGIALALSIRFAWVRGNPDDDIRQIEAGFAALGALLLMAVPGDETGMFRNPWALTFLLKPNHALGLVLVPLASLAIARARTWKSRLLAGFILQLVGWAFVIHMALFVAGLVVFVALSWVTRRPDRARDLIDTSVAIGINLLIVSPYLYILVIGYPFLHGSDFYRLSFFSERPFEGPLRMGLLTLISGWGAWHAYREGSRLGRILAAQWLTAQIIWQLFPLLGLIGQAREQDEAFYWCRFWTGLFGGVGLFGLVSTTGQRLGQGALSARAKITAPAAMTLILVTPSLLPVWWNPLTMDPYMVAARRSMPDWIDAPTRFIRDRTPIDAVFVGDRNYGRWIAAYGARRVLLANSMNQPGDSAQRVKFEKAAMHDETSDTLIEGMARYGVRYLLLTNRPMEVEPKLTADDLLRYKTLEVVYDQTFPSTRVTIFKLRPGVKPS